MTSSSIFDPPAGDPKHVLCVGAAVLDTLFRVRTLPSGQGKVLPYDMLQIAEGMASSAAYAVAQLGGMRKERPGVMRAIMMTIADFSAFSRAMP